jgi:hypothetical protein
MHRHSPNRLGTGRYRAACGRRAENNPDGPEQKHSDRRELTHNNDTYQLRLRVPDGVLSDRSVARRETVAFWRNRDTLAL